MYTYVARSYTQFEIGEPGKFFLISQDIFQPGHPA